MNIKNIAKLTSILALAASYAFAGNKDRTGQAGATQLLVNPWGASNGVFMLNAAHVGGIEAQKVNVAGLTKTVKTEIGIAHTNYLAGYGIAVNNLAVAQNLGDIGVIGVNIMSMKFGDLPITTTANPTAGIGSFSPNFLNASIGFAHKFSNNMSAGISVTAINESVVNIKAGALGIDAGVQYTNGKNDNFHLGITLRNVGSSIRYSGDGFSFDGKAPDGETPLTINSRADKYSLPSQLNIGLSYDFYLKENGKTADTNGKKILSGKHKLTPMISFISNAFNNDWIGAGAEYTYNKKFMLRAAYRYENNIFDKANNTTFYNGISAGLGFKTKLSSKATAPGFQIDYAFRPTRIAGGIHTVGLRIMLGASDDADDE
jgi:hypothetical protein